MPVQGTTCTTNACQLFVLAKNVHAFVVLKYYAKKPLVFQQKTSTTIVAHEVYHYTTMRKTLGVTIYIARVSKFICIQDNKTFKMKHFARKLSNDNKLGENDVCFSTFLS